MAIIATTAFYDLAEGKQRKQGERWNADAERAEFLISIGYAEAAPDRKVPEPKKDEEPAIEKE